MKRYQVLNFDFDTRATLLNLSIEESNKRLIRVGLLCQFGVADGDEKIKDFTEIGPAPVSVLAFHNKFMLQLRCAFTIGSYYPALTAACALGERILNHLILGLREHYKATPEYKNIYRKQSFDNWDMPITALANWGVLLPDVVKEFGRLRDIRNRTIHFHPDTDTNDRELALNAISSLTQIINGQFGAIGPLPWFIPNTHGTAYIKRSYEDVPFIKLVYLPNCQLVGPLNELEHRGDQWIVKDDHAYPDQEVTDEQFVRMANVRKLDA